MNVLYLSYTGILEPLGQSQVLSYLRTLSKTHRITLISAEKADDLVDTNRLASAITEIGSAGISWKPIKYHSRPRLLATTYDVFQMLFYAMLASKRRNCEVIHARSNVAAVVALVVGYLRGIPFIFDMRAFWVDEMVAAGRLMEGQLLYRVLKRIEHVCLTRAGAVIVLTEAARDLLRSEQRYRGLNILVIPTCADLDRFSPAPTSGVARPFTLGCVGTVDSGWFRVDWLVSLYGAIRKIDPFAVLRVVTRDDPGVILREAARQQVDQTCIEIYGREHSEIAHEIRQMDVTAIFYDTKPSEAGRSPTRLAESLGCGVPCVANTGVGDVACIVREDQVGVVVDEPRWAEVANAVYSLREDSEMSTRCREAAVRRFSLQSGVAKYDAAYREMAST